MGRWWKDSAGSKGSQFAPPHQHPKVLYGGLPMSKFPEEFKELKDELESKMSGEYPKIDNGSGTEKTILPGTDLRYDREKSCHSYGHLNDQFQAYSVQANLEAEHPYIEKLANNANGQHRAPKQSRPGEPLSFGRSTIASVNLQHYTSRPLSPQR